jgi:hypothetical protein
MSGTRKACSPQPRGRLAAEHCIQRRRGEPGGKHLVERGQLADGAFARQHDEERIIEIQCAGGISMTTPEHWATVPTS